MPVRLPLAALALLLSAAASAQPLVTDRPDLTESAVTIAPGRVQIEAGAIYEDAGSGFSAFAVPTALVRVGVLPFLEVRLGAPDFLRVETPLGSDEGIGDPSIGAKLAVGAVAGVDLALLAETSLPLGDDDLNPDRTVPSVLLIAGTDLGPAFSLGAQGGITYNEPGLEGADLSATLVLGYALDDQIGAFTELAVIDRIDEDAPAALLVHTGATLLLSDEAQLDAHVGAGLSDTAPELLVGVGASVRL